LGDVLEGHFGQVPEDALGQLQDRDQGSRGPSVAGDDFIQAGQKLLL